MLRTSRDAKIGWDEVGRGLAVESAKTRERVRVSNLLDMKMRMFMLIKTGQRDVRANVATIQRVTNPTSRCSREWKFQHRDVSKKCSKSFVPTSRR